MLPLILLYLLRLVECDVVFVINIDSQLECCDEQSESYVDTSALIVSRYNETCAYMHGNVKFHKDVGPNVMMEIVLMKETSGKQQLLFSHEVCDLCVEMKSGSESPYYSYIKYFNFTDCPFHAGEYVVNDFALDTNDFPVNAHNAGKYQVYFNIYNNPENDCITTKEFMYCMTLKLVIEPDECED